MSITIFNFQFVDWCPTGFKVGINYQVSFKNYFSKFCTIDNLICI